MARYINIWFWSSIIAFDIKRLLWNPLFNTAMCIAKIEKNMLWKTWLLKKQLRVQSIATKCDYHYGSQTLFVDFDVKLDVTLIYKAELHNTITRPLDDSYSYVKLIDNDDSAFFQFQNYSFKLRGQLCISKHPILHNYQQNRLLWHLTDEAYTFTQCD